MVDTNLVAEITRTIIAENAKTSVQWPVTIKDILTIAMPFMMGLMVWYQKRHDDKLKRQDEALKKQEEALKANTNTTEETQAVAREIKTEVNHERSTMISKLEVMNNAFVDVVKENATYREQKRVSDAAAVAAAAFASREPPVELSDLKALIKSMVESETALAEHRAKPKT